MTNKAPAVMIRTLMAVFLAVPACDTRAAASSEQVITATLNGLEIALDAKTGSILGLTYPGPGKMLQATPEAAGILDVACPQQKHPALRRASRFSSGVRISRTTDRVAIHWEDVGASQPSVDPSGRVAAIVTLEAAPDGKSVILGCRIENQSDVPITQVLFPDLIGLAPFGGAGETQFRLAATVTAPFVNLRPSPPDQLVGNPAITTYTSGGYQGPMGGRWMDLGSLAGGFSLFPKRWGLDPPTTVMLHLWETNKRVRLMIPHSVKVARGMHWESGQFVLTPHVSGWAKGIEPYRHWVKQNMKRVVPLPDHVRKGMGFRTIWMCQAEPADPQDPVFMFRDLPTLAQESKEHGLDEMVLWFTHHGFELPLPRFFEHLGGDAKFVKAVAECRKVGVNVAPFISVCIAKEKTMTKYGVKDFNTNYTYHPEFIPRLNPPYAGRYRGYQLDTRNAVWQAEVRASCKRLVDMGIPSLCWDQYFIQPPEPNLLTVTREIRAHSRQIDPQSTFSAEELHNFEVSADYLDYTWNWGPYRDVQPLVNAFPAPRVNFNVDASPAAVKHSFISNVYMNVQPRKPDSINGSDWIRNHPELSRALKQCAKLRTQFLPYFVDGTPIGDCILPKPCAGAQVCAYVLPDKILVIVLNTGVKAPKQLKFNPAPWLASTSGRYAVKWYDGEGHAIQSTELRQEQATVSTGTLECLGMALFELVALGQ
jgi:hypothetical protein